MTLMMKNKKNCIVCGKEFLPHSGSQKYCSKECRINIQECNYTRYKMQTMKRRKVICKFCGKDIAPFFREGIHRGNMHDLCRVKYFANKKLNKISYTAGDRTMMYYHGISVADIKNYIKNPQEWEA